MHILTKAEKVRSDNLTRQHDIQGQGRVGRLVVGTEIRSGKSSCNLEKTSVCGITQSMYRLMMNVGESDGTSSANVEIQNRSRNGYSSLLMHMCRYPCTREKKNAFEKRVKEACRMTVRDRGGYGSRAAC